MMRQSQRTRRGRRQQIGAEREGEEVGVDREDGVDLEVDVVEVVEEAFNPLHRVLRMIWGKWLPLSAPVCSSRQERTGYLGIWRSFHARLVGLLAFVDTKTEETVSSAQMRILQSFRSSHGVRHILSI